MIPEIELMRAAELAQGAENAHWLFWVVIGGCLILGLFWTLVRAWLDKQARRKAADRDFAREWEEFCRRNELTDYSTTSSTEKA
jgi:hypothetical protein